MALAVTHVILTIVILDFFRHYVFRKKKFPRYLLVIGGIAGLLPDIDIPLSWLYNLFTSSSTDLHGVFTHSLIFPLIFLVAAAILHYQKNMKWAKIYYVIAFGLFSHLVLDCLFGGYKTFFWPFNLNYNFCSDWGLTHYRTSIDAIILIVWLLHEEIHNKINDYF